MYNISNPFKRKKMPFVFQTNKFDCSLACISMIAQFYSIHAKIEDLKNNLINNETAINANTITDTFHSLGLLSRVVVAEIDELKKVKLPCILHWDMNHFVVLKKIKSGKFEIYDPERGILNIGANHLNEHFTGVVIEIYEKILGKRKPGTSASSSRKRNNLVYLLSILGTGKRILFYILILIFIIEVISILLPQITQLVIDKVIINRDNKLLFIAIIGYFLLSLILLMVSMARDWLVIWVNTHIGFHFPLELYKKIAFLPVKFFDTRSMGDILSRFDSLNVIKNTAVNQYVSAFLDLIMALMTFIMLFIYSKLLSVIVLTLSFSYVLIKLLSYQVYKINNVGTIRARAREQGSLIESIRNNQLLRLNPDCTSLDSNYTESLVELINAQSKLGYINIVFSSFNILLSTLKNVSILYLGGKYIISGEFSVGMLVAFIAYSEQFSRRTVKLIDFIMKVYLTGVHIDRIEEIINLSHNVKNSIKTQTINSKGIYINIKNLTHFYSEYDVVFENVSLSIKAGEAVLITGKSGCGKSTLVKIILGLISPTAGIIQYDGFNSNACDINYILKNTGTVMQGDTLISGTLLFNISLNNNTGIDEIIEITIKLGVHDFVNKLPLGYYTQVGDINHSLSTGQIQRILLARALFKKPKLLILDEATSNLDIESELMISQVLHDIKCTKIIISHKYESRDFVDKVMIVDNKKIYSVSERVNENDVY
ncbi:peptidase domain-containing ABC transporter [Salmonella enterica subsp. enterica]|nr:peptidase domain-containing ABC transporter [Salmonella enterica subsp. enterica serovar Hvittingfoss]